MLIYKIFRKPEWTALLQTGQSTGAPIDVTDGYIHLSTGTQVAETAARHFAGVPDLMLLALDADQLTDLKWEPSRGGALFPHLYRVLQRDDVIWAKPLPLTNSGHDFKGLL